MSEHFSEDECVCPCCSRFLVNDKLIEELEHIRHILGDFPMIINSWCRCQQHNEYVGGASNSKHLFINGCMAVDFYVKKLSFDTIYEKLDKEYAGKYGIGIYKNHIHFDIRNSYARWKS